MTIGLMFWVIMVVAFVFGLYSNRDHFGTWLGNNLATLILFALLGWAVFGPVIHR